MDGRESVAETRSPGQGGSSTLEALAYDFGLCDRCCVIDSAECQWQRVIHLGVAEAVRWKLSLKIFGLWDRRSLTHFAESVAWARGKQHAGKSPFVFGLCDRISATSSAVSVHLGSGEAARWKLYLMLLDSVTKSLRPTQ